MNSSPVPQRRFLSILIEAIDPKATVTAFLAGWAAWIALILLSGLAGNTAGATTAGNVTTGYSLLEIFENHWQSAFFGSAAIVLLAGIYQNAKRRLPWHAAFTNIILYVGPMALVLIGFAVLDALHKNHPLARDMHQTMGIVLVLFYLLGIGYLRVKARRESSESLSAFLLPTYVVAVLFVGLSVFQVLNSVEYVYRNAFWLTVQTVETRGGKVHITGTLHVNKAAPYICSAYRNDMIDTPETDSGETLIVWENASPAAEGDYAFRITCKERKKDPAIANGMPEGYYDYEPLVYLQVSLKPEDGNGYPRSVKSLPISTWEIADYAPPSPPEGQKKARPETSPHPDS
ncbi:MAG: hypothetical protein LBK99_15665 [Opitutaceae bacterium]|jgi:hypothetical protein|nr:hypothetical protein [Opitutaceae bacterium]